MGTAYNVEMPLFRNPITSTVYVIGREITSD
jgi:hypothetical protein